MLPLVEKRVFELAEFRTFHGAKIRDLRVGWEAYGEMNADKSNVILICHYFTGTSHAAGKYADCDLEPGYWDAIIGPGKAVDTDKYCVISVDSLANINAYDPNVTTAGPASRDPATGAPYGMRFPIVTIRDFVEVQRALLDSLGVGRLHAVMGPSMGALQTYEWAAAHPERLGRIVPVIGGGWASADLIARLNIWGAPIRLDPDWRGGDYYDGAPPRAGLIESLKLITHDALHQDWAEAAFGRNWAEATRDPAADHDHLFAVEAALEAAARDRALLMDANHLLYLAKANQLFFAGHEGDLYDGLRRAAAPALIVYQPKDRVFHAELVEKTAAILREKAGAALFPLEGSHGHLDGIYSIAQAADAIREFLARP
ncbi:MAG: homoserine O-acetyltransferase [Parvularculaceae bacterium]